MKKQNEAADCGILFKQINDHLERDANQMLKKRELTLSQFRYLVYLCQHKGETVYFKDLEGYFQTSQPTVSGILNRLERKGLIEINCADVGRAKIAALTEKGRQILAEAGEHRESEEGRLLEALDPQEREQLRDMLIRINNFLQKGSS